ncbi:perforin-1-like [Odontesthes bonariensis]|uniref:perforin-1-like n=1 Tax=Odontesthes bonariensis TaxID=219752 RepID=UPI003F58B250
MFMQGRQFPSRSSDCQDIVCIVQLNSSMFLVNVWLCAGFLLYFPQCTYASCTPGTPRQCQEAEFAPGSTLAGEGFDITKMERKGAFLLDMNQWKHKDKTCTLCSNPYLESKKQKLPLSVVDWRAKQSCSAKVSSKLHKSSESLVSSSSFSVENDWKASLDVAVGDKSGSLMLAGTNSRLADYSMEKTKNDKFSFTSNGMSCEYYSYRVSSTPKLHKEFRKAVKQLPKVYSPEYKQRFHKLIDNFGTHYITKVKLGGSLKSVTSIRQCEASLQGLSVEEVQMCLEAEASVSTKVNAKAEAKHCQRDSEKRDDKKDFSDLFNDRFTEIKGGHTTEPDLLFSANKDPSAYKEWLTTVPQNPEIISYSLDSLHELLPANTPVRKNLRSAISHYILERGLWRNCSDRCQVGIKSDSRDSCVCQCHNEPTVNQDCCPTRKGMARVIITVQRATGLWGDHTTATDGYVKVSFGGNFVQRTRVIVNSNDPHWSTVVDLGLQDLSSKKTVRFEVWDQDSNYDDDLLGECEKVVSAGVRVDVCPLQHGRLYYKWEVECVPSLTGDSCTTYKPSPMSQSLRGLYVSRHAHPIPKSILVKMGVFVDETTSVRNQSVTAEI